MLIAEKVDVARAYPAVPQPAIDHVLAALHRTVPMFEAGDTAAGIAELRADLAAYAGDLKHLEYLGIRAIFEAAGHGRQSLAAILGELRLLQPGTGTCRYVIIGDAIAARLWARSRGIGYHTVTQVRSDRDRHLLFGLRPSRDRPVHVIELSRPPAGEGDQLLAALGVLLSAGALRHSPGWRPGRGEPAADADPNTGPPPLDFGGDRTR